MTINGPDVPERPDVRDSTPGDGIAVPTTSSRPRRESRNRRRWGGLLRRIAFSVVTVLTGLLFLAGIDHLADWMRPLPLTESLLFPGNSRFVHDSCEFHVTVATSRQGLRDREFSINPPSGTVRIVAVGDSFTFGWGVEAEQSWPKVLEHLLNQPGTISPESDSGRVEVLNFGVPGTSPIQYAGAAEKALRHFHPQLLIIGTLQGDDLIQLAEASDPPRVSATAIVRSLYPTAWRLLHRRKHPEPMVSYRRTFLMSQQYIRSTFTHRQAARYRSLPAEVRSCFEKGLLNPTVIQTAITRPNHFLTPLRTDDAWRESVSRKLHRCLSQIRRACQRHDCRLVVAVVPYGPYVSRSAIEGLRTVGFSVDDDLLTTQEPDRIVQDVCAGLGIECFVQTREFRNAAEPRYFLWDGHFNRTGHAKFASGLAKQLSSEPVTE